MARYLDDFKLNDKGYGPLKFTKRGFDTDKKSAALLGRSVALYDFIMDFETDLRVLSDAQARINKFRDICIWVDSTETRKIRNAFSAICRDYPGKGKDQVADPAIDIGDVEEWYEWEYEALEATKSFSKTSAVLFDWNRERMSKALKIPFKVVNLLQGYSELPGDDLVAVYEYASEFIYAMADWQMVAEDMTVDSYDEELVAPYRQLFIDRWQRAEDKLLSVLPRERRGVKIYG